MRSFWHKKKKNYLKNNRDLALNMGVKEIVQMHQCKNRNEFCTDTLHSAEYRVRSIGSSAGCRV